MIIDVKCLNGGIATGHKAHWDSEKEYEKFWSGHSNIPEHPKKNKKVARYLIILFFVLGVIVATFTQNFNSDWGLNTDYSHSTVESNPEMIPDFSGKDYIDINQNQPNFTVEDKKGITGEHYSELDRLGRCGTAYALLDHSMMPEKEREGIGQIKPSGWNQNKYEGIVDSKPPYLYNRCHLIAYALTGQNSNERNLITGTRYFNATAMLPFEERVMKYLDNSENHVLYRVSPLFREDELVARGVEMEAYSVEDNGAGICFHVFIYNYQPGIEIDYNTGENWIQ